ncbi:9312_t:CDS:1, partial [Racocetra fulgida]
TLWNHDANAARNIHRLFLHMNSNNDERLEEFHRPEDRDRYGGEELPFAVATSGVSRMHKVGTA